MMQKAMSIYTDIFFMPVVSDAKLAVSNLLPASLGHHSVVVSHLFIRPIGFRKV